ncbi:MAG TPA: glycosyltransferase family 4 protein [Pseudonocardia sp.]|nr:glycosyltransferase family 4 protein [Pseudonocardia sp.]
MSTGTPRVLLASVEDVADVRAWSGTPFHMHRALLDAGVDVVVASPLRERFALPLKAAQLVRNTVGRTRYSRLREPVVLRGYAGQVRRLVARVAPDVVLAPGTLPVALLDVGVPIVTWTDATFAGMVGFYPSYSGLSARHLRLGHEMERAALSRVALAVYSSEWAARSAVDAYGMPPERVAVVPFGANVPDPGPPAGPPAPSGPCRLLLVGRGWERKGVDLAVELTRVLRGRDVPATLDVVGSPAPPGVEVPPFVTVHGPLEKDRRDTAERIRRLYADAAFFVLPTRADCTPVVLAEAQAHGVPVLTSDVGGVASQLRPGRSGHALDLGSFVEEAARHVESAWRSPERYAAMREEARRCYEEALNWTSATAALLRAVACAVRPGAGSGTGSGHVR